MLRVFINGLRFVNLISPVWRLLIAFSVIDSLDPSHWTAGSNWVIAFFLNANYQSNTSVHWLVEAEKLQGWNEMDFPPPCQCTILLVFSLTLYPKEMYKCIISITTYAIIVLILTSRITCFFPGSRTTLFCIYISMLLLCVGLPHVYLT